LTVPRHSIVEARRRHFSRVEVEESNQELAFSLGTHIIVKSWKQATAQVRDRGHSTEGADIIDRGQQFGQVLRVGVVDKVISAHSHPETNGFDEVWQSTASIVLIGIGIISGRVGVGASREHTALVIIVGMGNKVGGRRVSATREIAIITILAGRGRIVLARFLMGSGVGSSAGPSDSWILAPSRAIVTSALIIVRGRGR